MHERRRILRGDLVAKVVFYRKARVRHEEAKVCGAGHDELARLASERIRLADELESSAWSYCGRYGTLLEPLPLMEGGGLFREEV